MCECLISLYVSLRRSLCSIFLSKMSLFCSFFFSEFAAYYPVSCCWAASVHQVAGGNSIFNVIVDTDNTAAKLMSMLERRRLGRVTFMPLNRLKGREGRRFQIPPEMPVAHLIDVSGVVQRSKSGQGVKSIHYM